MTITKQVTKDIIKKLLNGEDYRILVVSLINDEFLRYTIDFFQKVAAAKLKNENITTDWYKKHFLDPTLPAKDIAIHAGINKKTIHNMFNSARKEIVIEASQKNYEMLYKIIKEITDTEPDLDINLTLKLNKANADLTLSESLIVINSLAVKRAELRGGLWSSAGKRVEEPLMLILCGLYNIPKKHYLCKTLGKNTGADSFEREVDFYLISGSPEHHKYKCEVKLMGRGNPESADAVIARDSKIFVADKLSDMNKRQLTERGIAWVEFRSELGFRKFEEVLKQLKIPHKKLPKTHQKTYKTFEKKLESLLADL